MKKLVIITNILFLCSLGLMAQTKKTPQSSTSQKKIVSQKSTPQKNTTPIQKNKISNKLDSASYSLGIKIIQNLKQQGLDSLNVDLLALGMKDFINKNPFKIKDSLLEMCIGLYQQEIMSSKSKEEKEKGLAFLLENKKRKEVTTLPSGLQYEIIKLSDKPLKPTLQSKVKCHYHGTLIDGTIFDSSVERGQPAEFPLSNVILGWQEGLQLMPVGSKFKFYIPSNLGYGDRQAGPKIKPGSTLIFEVELLDVEN